MNFSLRGLIPLTLFLALGLAFTIGLNKDPKALPTQMIDRPFPSFEMTDLFDPEKTHTEADMMGQVTLVNIFGSWCAACVVEHPVLMRIAKQETITLVGVDWRDQRNKAQDWLARYGNPYAKVIFDESSQLAIDLGVTGAPESFIVDKAGRIRHKHVGIITPEIWQDSLRPLIETLEAKP